MGNPTLATKALLMLKHLNPKHYGAYFKAFYSRHGVIKTFTLLYVFSGLLFMFLKSYGLWFKKSIKDKHVFITDAGSGIGRLVAIKMSQIGAKITVSDINLQSAEETVKLIKNKAGFAIAVQLDVTSVEDIHNAHEVARSKFGDVHILINNAGIAFGKWSEVICRQKYH